MLRFIIILLIALTVAACGYFKKETQQVVAKIYDKKLTVDDIKDIFPEGISAKDSISLLNNFIHSWAQNQVVLRKAEKNLSKKQMDFSAQIEDYRNSLVIYAYQNELVRQKIDTLVGDKEINEYYSNNPSEFELRENILRVIYVKTNLDEPNNKLFRSLYKSDKEADIIKLGKLAEKYAANYFLEEDKWLYFNDLLKEVPIKTNEQESYLKNNSLIELKDSIYNYFVNIKAYKTRKTTAPLSMEKDNIKKIIINNRKLKLIKEMEEEAYKKALKDGELKIYTNK